MAVFTNARIVSPDAVIDGALSTEGPLISAIDTKPNGGEIIDCDGDVLMPGIVDIHTDNLEKHYYPRPDVDWDPVSAAIVHDSLCASVGVTTVFDSLSLGSMGGGSARELGNYLKLIDGLDAARSSGALKGSHYLHWRCETTSPALPELLDQLIDRELTGLLSVMDHTPGQRQYANLDKHMSRWRDHLGLTQEQAEIRYQQFLENQAAYAEPNRKIVAQTAKARDLPLASHDDQTVDHVKEAAELDVGISEFPTTAEAAAAAKKAGMTVVMGGPNLMRGGSYSGNVAASQVANAGHLDAFASDYVPRSLIESAFALAASPLNWSLPDAVATVTATPAKAVNLTDRGVIAEGKRADLIRVKLINGHPIVRGVWSAGVRVA